MKNTLRILLSFGLASVLWGAPETEPVSFSFEMGNNAEATMTVYGEGSTQAVSLTAPTTQESAIKTVPLKPGKGYEVKFEMDTGPSPVTISFIEPQGYVMLIDNEYTQTIDIPSGSYPYLNTYTIELRRRGLGGHAPLASVTGISAGQAILWQVGLGSRSNQGTSGVISWREEDLTSGPANRDKLFYTPVDNYADIWVNPDTNNSDWLRQIRTPGAYIDIVDINSLNRDAGYLINFYEHDQIQGSSPYDLIKEISHEVYEQPWKTIKVESPAANQLKITETEGSVTRVSHLSLTSGTISSGTYVLTLNEGDGSTTPRTTTFTSAVVSGTREVTTVVKNASSVVATETKRVYDDFAWGEEIIKVIQDPSSAALETEYTYHTTASQEGNYGRVKTVEQPTGNWSATEYYDDWDRRGQVKYTYQPYNDLPATPTLSTSQGLVTYQTYTSDWTGRERRPASRTTHINNTQVGRTDWSWGDTVGYGWPREHATITSYRDGSNYQQSHINRHRSDAGKDEPGMLRKQWAADGTQTSFSWDKGDFNSNTGVYTLSGGGDHRRTRSFHGRKDSATGTTPVSGWGGQTFSTVHMIPHRSIMEAKINDSAGRIVRTESYIYTGGVNFDLVSWTDYTYDADTGRLTGTEDHHGSTTDRIYSGGRLATSVAIDGSETTYTYDALGRAATITKKGAASRSAELTGSYSYLAQTDVVTTNTYDASNRIKQQVVSSGGPSLTTTNVFDKAGRPTSTTAPGNFTTSMAYANGGRTVTTTLPGGGTQITDTYLDGQPKSLTGTAVVSQHHTPFLGSGGKRGRQTYTGGVGTNATNTYWDWLGRQIEQWAPGWNSVGWLVTKNHYNSSGQLWKTEAPGVAPMLYEYDTLGVMWRSGLDVDGGGLDNASMDRITETTSDFTQLSGNWHARTQTHSYLGDNSSTETLMGKTLTKLENLASGRISESLSEDIFGNETTTFTHVDDVNHVVTTTTQTSLTTDSDVTSITYNGRAVESRDSTGIIIRTEHDALGRPTKVIHPRTGTAETAYITNTSLVAWTKDTTGTQQATYAYDTAGRTAYVYDPYGKYTRFAYNNRSQVTHTWGEATYPTQNVYDSHGRRTQLKTYRDGSGWNGTSWPGSPGTADTTTWAYDAATGLLNSKTDAASRTVSYTYTAAAQLDVRTWARGVTTDYTYDANTGEMTSADYSDSTTDITNVYNRRGLLDSVTDVTGTRTFDYCDCGKVTAEHLGTFHASAHLTYQLDATTTGAKGRTTGYTLKDSGNTTTLHQLIYDFDASGRLDEITTAGELGAHTFDYGYLANSNLVTTLDVDSGSSADPFQFARTWESNRNLVATATTKWSTTTKAKYEYTYDVKNRRESAIQSGTAFADYLADTHRRYTYNDRSELVSDVSYANAVITGTPTGDMSGRHFEFAYDNLGNRTSSNRTGVAALADDYTTNNLNQYTARENNTLAVSGTVASSSVNVSVTAVGGGAAQQAGRAQGFWGAEVLPNNSTAPVNQTVNVTAADPGAGSGGADLVSTDSRTTPVGPASETHTYDLDGNLLSDGLYTYEWDAENRMIAMQTNATQIWSGVNRRRYEHKYDYLHRRVHSSTQANVGSWLEIRDSTFYYEGWNVIREKVSDMDLGTTFYRTYAWGLDVVGSLSSSAGVQGLIAMRDSYKTKTYLPGYDANGNVTVLLDAADGSIEATYEYSPFGQYLRKEGDYAEENPIRFSTKYTDEETNLVYYGRRYYDPKDGRFVGRDPIQEKGGNNLYRFGPNSPINGYDLLGQEWLHYKAVVGYEEVDAYYWVYWNGQWEKVSTTAKRPIYGTVSKWIEPEIFDTPTGGGVVTGGGGTGAGPSSTGRPGCRSTATTGAYGSQGSFDTLFRMLFPGSFDKHTVSSADKELALLADSVYEGGLIPEGWSSVDSAGISGLNAGLLDDDSGFQAGIYRNDNTGEFVVSFRGTEEPVDWVANGAQTLGVESEQYNLAVLVASAVNAHASGNVRFTGHSLGGGLASVAGLSTGRETVTFNAAGIAQKTLKRYNLDANDAGSIIRAYSVHGEVLNRLQDRSAPWEPFHEALGQRIVLRQKTEGGPITQHGMSSVLSALDCE